jgi:hypothetical protein
MKRITVLLLALILAFGFSQLGARADVDLTGTWEGPTYAEGAGMELVLTLVLEQQGSTISGTIKDDQGYVDCEIKEPSLEDDVLKFQAMAVTPGGDLFVEFRMQVTESTMEGEWQAEDGSSGIWNPKKK